LKLCTIVGARPQFIKAAALSRCIQATSDLDEVLVHTGQHYDANMSDIFFSELDIPKPKYHLQVGGGTHGENTGRMIERIERVLLDEKADCLIVYGDTNSTLAGAIAASKLALPIAHVEAGLRSYNRKMPEEINRILTDHVSHFLFTPTDLATQNLLQEGIDAKRIQQVGDLMLDAALFYQNKAQPVGELKIDKDFIICTFHRAENINDETRFSNIINALNIVGKDIKVVIPLHPRTKKMLTKMNVNFNHLIFIEPVGYLQMIWLLKQCVLVVTDSGGLQKEAFFFGKPCVTTRNETEWVELVDYGANRLVGSDPEKIILAIQEMYFQTIVFCNKFYGEGFAADRIVEELRKHN